MYKVKSGALWCPQSQLLNHLGQCARPPPRKQLAHILREIVTDIVCAEDAPLNELEPMVQTMELVEKKLADQSWLLKAICALRPEHEIFSKGYAYIKPKGVDTFND